MTNTTEARVAALNAVSQDMYDTLIIIHEYASAAKDWQIEQLAHGAISRTRTGMADVYLNDDDSDDDYSDDIDDEANYSDDDKPALTDFQKGRLERIAQKKGVSAESLRTNGFLMALIRHPAWQKEA